MCDKILLFIVPRVTNDKYSRLQTMTALSAEELSAILQNPYRDDPPRQAWLGEESSSSEDEDPEAPDTVTLPETCICQLCR